MVGAVAVEVEEDMGEAVAAGKVEEVEDGVV